MLRTGGFGGSQLSTLHPQAQGITTAFPNPPCIRRDSGVKVQRAGDTAASHREEIPIQKSHSDTSLWVQGPPSHPLVPRHSQGTQGEVTAPRGSPGDVGVLLHRDTAPQTVPSVGTKQREELARAQSRWEQPGQPARPGAAAAGSASRSWPWLPVSFPLPRLPPCQAAISPAFTGLREDDSAASQTTLGTNVQSVPRNTPGSPGRPAELQGMP